MGSSPEQQTPERQLPQARRSSSNSCAASLVGYLRKGEKLSTGSDLSLTSSPEDFLPPPPVHRPGRIGVARGQGASSSTPAGGAGVPGNSSAARAKRTRAAHPLPSTSGGSACIFLPRPRPPHSRRP